MSAVRVYISFAEADRIACERVATCLRAADADVWLGGHNPPDTLLDEDELRARPIFVVLLSEAAYESPQIERACRLAVTLAREQPQHRVVPLVVHPTHYVGTWAFLDGIPRLHLYDIPPLLLAERILAPPDASQGAPPHDTPLEDVSQEPWLMMVRRYRGLARAEARSRIRWPPGPHRINIRSTRAAISALQWAQAKAVERQYPLIEPEHLLSGIVSCPSAGALEVLAACGVRPQLIEAQLRAMLPRGDHPLQADVRMSSRSSQAIQQAVFAGRAIGRMYFGTTQLLLGVFSEGGAACTLLESYGLSREAVQATASRLLRPHLPW